MKKKSKNRAINGVLKTYMVGVRARVSVLLPAVFLEVVAKNAKDAQRQANQLNKKKKLSKEWRQEFMDELTMLLEDVPEDFKFKVSGFTDAGRANQYHSTSECKMCASVEKKPTVKTVRVKRTKTAYVVAGEGYVNLGTACTVILWALLDRKPTYSEISNAKDAMNGQCGWDLTDTDYAGFEVDMSFGVHGLTATQVNKKGKKAA